MTGRWTGRGDAKYDSGIAGGDEVLAVSDQPIGKLNRGDLCFDHAA